MGTLQGPVLGATCPGRPARPHLPQVAPSAAWAAVSIPPPHQTSPDRSFVVSLGSGPVSIKGEDLSGAEQVGPALPSSLVGAPHLTPGQDLVGQEAVSSAPGCSSALTHLTPWAVVTLINK